MTPIAWLIGGGAVLLGVIVGAVAWLRVRRRLDALVAAAEATLGAGTGSLADRTAAIAARLGELGAVQHRLTQIHPLTGLPTREPLAARIAADADGTLAAIAITDFDRISAFDPQAGEQTMLAVVARLTGMISTRRFVAQIDRGHLAIWLPGTNSATAELEALAYALSERITIDGREILPDIAMRQVRVRAGEPAAQAAISRALASFATEPTAAGAVPIDAQAIARERFLLEQDLRQAVTRGELRLHLQPLIDAGEGKVCGAEALLRWQHPSRGLVSPTCFVPVMEAAGLSHEIGLWTLNAAVRQARAWRTAGLGPLRVAVNVSGHQLDEQHLDEMVARTLARHSVGADALEIELTESVAMGDGGRAAALFAALHALGVRIAIDDFGTGYSSLSTLRTLAFDKIKIDREFVTDVGRRKDSQAICQSILALGRGLGIRVLAEGVETAAEYAWLRRHGCQHFQGFYFSPPLDEAAFVTFARDTAALARLLAAGGDIRAQQIERVRA